MTMRKKLFAPFLVFIVLITALCVAYTKPSITQTASPLADFSLPDITGTEISIRHWQGKILVINFWATWCPPCLKEIPEFIALQSQYAEQNVQFIGIAIDDPEIVADYLSFTKINYPILIAESEGGALSYKLGNTFRAVPYTIIVNQQNQIIYRHPGDLTKQQLSDLIEPLLSPSI